VTVSPLQNINKAREAWEAGYAILVCRANELLEENGVSLAVESGTAVTPADSMSSLPKVYERLVKHLRLLEAEVDDLTASEFRPWQFGRSLLDVPPIPSFVDQMCDVFSGMYEGDQTWKCEFVEPMRHHAQTVREWFDGLERQLAEPSHKEVAWMHRGGLVMIGDEQLKLEGSEADVLEALVVLQAATTADLIERSGRGDSAPRVLRKIYSKHTILQPFITLPKRKGQGGYRTTIRPV